MITIIICIIFYNGVHMKFVAKSFLMLFIFLFLQTTAIANQVEFYQVVKQLPLQGDALVKAYELSSAIDTGDEFSNLYFDDFEARGMEAVIGMDNPALKTSLESQFSLMIGYTMKEATKAKVQEAWEVLKVELQETAKAKMSQPS